MSLRDTISSLTLLEIISKKVNREKVSRHRFTPLFIGNGTPK